MTDTRLIDGKQFAVTLCEHIAGHVASLRNQHQITPGLAVVLVGEDPASQVYVRNKIRQTKGCGMHSIEHRLAADTSQADLLALIAQLNADPAIHGILVQLPLPKHLDDRAVITAIDPAKDVDGFHIDNVGRLTIGLPAMVPCTPLGCIMLLEDHFGKGGMKGKHALVIGRSNIVGKPMATLLLQQDCTVTTAHRWTADLKAEVARADIVVAAVGQAQMVQGSWLKEGAVVIDVGINRLQDATSGTSRLVGDVDTASTMGRAAAITPVPGGVGPMTIACLLRNCLVAAHRQHGLADPF